MSRGNRRFGPRPGALIVGTLGVWLGLGCSSELPPAGGVEVIERDSSGVRVVEYAALSTTIGEWRLTEPAVRLGSESDDGPELFAFGNTPPTTPVVVERSDGAVIVGDVGSRELRAFDSAGQHLWTAGGRGTGPGEFTGISGIYLMPGDLVAVEERTRSLISMFDVDGRLTHQVRLLLPDGAGLRPSLAGILSDGVLVSGSTADFPFVPGSARPDLIVHLHASDGMGRDAPVVRFPGPEYVLRGEAGVVRGMGPPPLAKEGLLAVGREHFAVTDQNRMDLTIHRADGSIATIIRVSHPLQPVDSDLRARYIATRIRLLPEDADVEEYRTRVEAETFPEFLPAVQRVLFDAADRLWVQEFSRFDGSDPAWWVFDPDGTLLARAHVPAELAVQQISSDYIWAIVFDALGVPYIERRLIVR